MHQPRGGGGSRRRAIRQSHIVSELGNVWRATTCAIPKRSSAFIRFRRPQNAKCSVPSDIDRVLNCIRLCVQTNTAGCWAGALNVIIIFFLQQTVRNVWRCIERFGSCYGCRFAAKQSNWNKVILYAYCTVHFSSLIHILPTKRLWAVLTEWLSRKQLFENGSKEQQEIVPTVKLPIRFFPV